MRPLVDLDLISDALEKGQWIVTPNNRLANQIANAWAALQDQSGRSSWLAPKVAAQSQWLDQLWLEYCHRTGCAEAVIPPRVASQLWKQVIEQLSDLPYPNRYRSQAESAWQTLQLWQQDPAQLPHWHGACQQLRQWGDAFETRVTELGMITDAERCRRLISGFEQGELPCQPVIYLFAFQSLPPLYQAVWQTAAESVESPLPGSTSTKATHLPLPSASAELVTATRWLARQWQQQPDGRYGLIMPDLNQRLPEVLRVLQEELPEGLEFNLSAAIALADTPQVTTALTLLRSWLEPLAQEQWLRLLWSPFWIVDQLSIAERNAIELALRAKKLHQLSWRQVVRVVLEQVDDPDRPAIKTLSHWLGSPPLPRNKQSISEWQSAFCALLKGAGWPGNRVANSLEYQQMQQWQTALENLLQYQMLGGEYSGLEALSLLQELCRQSPFHPETTDSPLQVLGLLEGAGLRFDAVWIAGMDTTTLPAPVSPNPMLPIALQRTTAMPRSSPQQESALAAALFNVYQSNSRQLVASYPQFKGAAELKPSVLIASLPTASIAISESFHPVQHHRRTASVPLSVIADGNGPAFDPEKERYRGGSAMFAAQSHNPFAAFAHYRLDAEPLDQPETGITGLERGQLVHQALHQLWQQWPDQHALVVACDDGSAERQCRSVAERCVKQLAAISEHLYSPRLQQIEIERLYRLLIEAVKIDRQRATSFAIVALEQRAELDFDAFTVGLRFDRIDRTAQGDIVLDYKTGKVDANDWYGERPANPQLPLYALAHRAVGDHSLAGLGFFILRSEGGKFSGVTQQSDTLPGVKAADDWPQQLQQWEQALHQLAQEFANGVAYVAKHHRESFGQTDPLLPLTRWPERERVLNQLSATVGSSTP